MNITAIQIIKEVGRGNNNPDNLIQNIGIKEWQLNSHLKDLNQAGILQKENNEIKFLDGLKPATIRDLSKTYNLEKILRSSGEIIFSYLIEPISINEIYLKTGLSQSTIYRSISDLESSGAITKHGDLYQIKQSDEKLVMLANILKTERTSMYEANAEIIYRDDYKTLKKVTRGKITDGEPTGFSLFTEYGIEYHTNYDYYVKQEEPLTIQHVLMHAIYDSQRNADKTSLIMAIIFYLKHKDKMDVLELRKIAESLKIINVWLDVESYIRNNDLKNPTLFLPKEEFIEKANIYDISFDLYTLPEGYPKLFEEIGKKLPTLVRAYLIGGENMRIKGLKARTKDLDIVVNTKEEFDALVKALTELGYEPKGNLEYSKEDLRLFPSIIMNHISRSRIDLYTKKILRTLSLSSNMISRADLSDFNNLRLGILKNEDLFLLKAVTSREGDIQDMASIAQLNYVGDGQYRQKDFDWDIVWDEIMNQEKIELKQSFTEIIQSNLEWLRDQNGITSPFRNKLQRFVLDQQITKLLREGKISLKDIVDLLIDEENSEQTIRNRIDSLAKIDIVQKEYVDKDILISLVQRPIYPSLELKITPENIDEYLVWKFPTRSPTTLSKYQILSDELNSLGYNSIGDVDETISHTQETVRAFEKIYHKETKLSQIGALRISVGLSSPKIGLKGRTNYYVSNMEKFTRS